MRYQQAQISYKHQSSVRVLTSICNNSSQCLRIESRSRSHDLEDLDRFKKNERQVRITNETVQRLTHSHERPRRLETMLAVSGHTARFILHPDLVCLSIGWLSRFRRHGFTYLTKAKSKSNSGFYC